MVISIPSQALKSPKDKCAVKTLSRGFQGCRVWTLETKRQVQAEEGKALGGRGSERLPRRQTCPNLLGRGTATEHRALSPFQGKNRRNR